LWAMSSERRRPSVAHVLPILLMPFAGSALSELLAASGVLEGIEVPFAREEGPSSLAYNLAVFSAMFAPVVAIVYLLVRRRLVLALKLTFTLSLALAFAAVTELYAEAVLLVAGLYDELGFVTVPLSALAAAQAIYVALREVPEAYEAAVGLALGIAIGALFANLLPLWSVVGIALAVSAYDLYAVLRGPLKGLIDLERELAGGGGGAAAGRPRVFLLRGMTVPLLGFRVGLGDIIFYAMVITASYLSPYPSLLRSLATSAGVAAGAYLTLRILVSGRRAVPAMPLPSLLGLLALAISVALGL